MKVLVLTNLFPSAWYPFRAAFNRQQFERLGRRHEVEVLTAVDFRQRLRGRCGEAGVADVRADYFTFVYPPGFCRWSHAAFWYASLMLQHRRRLILARYDCILASWVYPDAVAASWLARRMGLPYAVKVHGSDINVLAEDRTRRTQIRTALREAGAVIAVSQALAEKVVQLDVPREQIHTLYNGIDTQLFSPGPRDGARQRLGLPEGSPIVLYVGNLIRPKGCVDLLEAFPAVLSRRPDARLIYVGTGKAREEIAERSTTLGIADRVQFAGAVRHAQLVDWFRSADLLCLPSHNEGVPNVILEAMACGIPVVASRVGGIPEVLPQHAGVIVPARESAALSGALIHALDRSWDSVRIVQHADVFRWDDNIDQLERILRGLVRS